MEVEEIVDMEVDEEEEESGGAMIVDRADLDNMSIVFGDDEEDEVEDVGAGEGSSSPKKKATLTSSPKSTTSSGPAFSSSARRIRRRPPAPLKDNTSGVSPSKPGPSSAVRSGGSGSSNVIDPDEEIRKATVQYLQGEMSATEFASMMEELERYKAEEGGEIVAKAVPPSSPPPPPPQQGPSLVLLNPDRMIPESESELEDHDHPPHPEVILTEAEVDEEGQTAEAKLRGEFFRTGDDTATFTVRKKRKMPPTVKSMMGEAHVRFARGDLAGSESICLEIIKEHPTYKDPFHTLAMIYENQGRVKRALQFFLISGLLDPKGFGDWPRLAELSVEEGNVGQAIMCLRKSIICDPTNVKSYMRRSELMWDLDDQKGALKGYHKVLNLSENDANVYMDVAKRIAGIHFKSNELDLAYDVLMGAVVKFSDSVTTAEMNLLAEVCISLKRYVKAVTLFMRYSGIRFDPSVPKVSFKERSALSAALNEEGRKCIVPIGLHADLVQKLAIILIHLEAFDMIQPVVSRLRDTEPLETFGIQLYEIAEAYLAKQRYEESLSILGSLIHSEQFSMAEIWLRYAECLFLLNRVEDSAEAYSKVIQLAPGHKIARLNLSVILQKLGRFDVALQSLSQHEMEDLIDQDLLVEKCNILFARGRIPEFYETAVQLFSRHCPEIRNYDEAHALVITSQTNQMLQALRSLRLRKGDTAPDSDINRIDPKPSDNAVGEWSVYLNLYKLLLGMNRPDLLNRLVYTVWASPLFAKDVRMKKDLDVQATFASVLAGDEELAPLHIRSLISTFGLSTIILKLISLACRRSPSGHTRYGRQLVRLLMKRPTDTRLMMLCAHNSFMNGTYKYALMEYLAILQIRKDDPLVHLMISTTLLHICSQKSTTNRSQLAIQGVAFIHRYAELRGEGQEVWYNLGRFYHYVGLTRGALGYYKRVLLAPPVQDGWREDYNVSDLKREAAFNIAQIYKATGAWALAKRYVSKYCAI